MMSNRRALTLVELPIVLAILAVMLGLLLPAVQSAREKAREAVCKNNLHQLNVAIASFTTANERLPTQNPPSAVGGWTIEILPFLEQSSLEQAITFGIAIPDAPEFLLEPPPIFRCPVRDAMDRARGTAAMHPGHYVFVAADRRDTFSLYDAPVQLAIPWASGPELAPGAVTRLVGPHHEGFHCASGFQEGVKLISGARSR